MVQHENRIDDTNAWDMAMSRRQGRVALAAGNFGAGERDHTLPLAPRKPTSGGMQ